MNEHQYNNFMKMAQARKLHFKTSSIIQSPSETPLIYLITLLNVIKYLYFNKFFNCKIGLQSADTKQWTNSLTFEAIQIYENSDIIKNITISEIIFQDSDKEIRPRLK